MELTFSNEFEYIPTFNNNREEENPVRVICRYMTTPERSKNIESVLMTVNGESQSRTVFHNDAILRASILRIENLKVNGVEITTAKALLAIEGLSQLSEEIASYIATRNLMPDLKN